MHPVAIGGGSLATVPRRCEGRFGRGTCCVTAIEEAEEEEAEAKAPEKEPAAKVQAGEEEEDTVADEVEDMRPDTRAVNGKKEAGEEEDFWDMI